MRIPRDLSGVDLVKRLGRLGYEVIRQTESHLRLTAQINGEHHVTVPNHDPMRMGTLAAIIASVAEHHGMSGDDSEGTTVPVAEHVIGARAVR